MRRRNPAAAVTLLVGRVLHEGRVADGWLRIEAGLVVELGWGEPPEPRAARYISGTISRGLVDLQVNGAGGESVTDGVDALVRIGERLLARGVTSFLPTVITTSDDEARAAVAAIAELARDPSSPVAGAHLEGPFLNPERRGVHRAELLREPADGVPPYYESDCVRLVTLAPELPGALELCRNLARRGVRVSIGHTSASPAVCAQAQEAGAAMATHLFNSMPPLHHRNPGVVGWALAAGRVALGLIADGHHVHPTVLRLVHSVAGERVVLTSDASVAALAPPGSYTQAGVQIEHTSDGRVVSAQGSLAGSGATLDELVQKWRDATGATLAEALRAASTAPARLVGLAADLAPGAPADLVVVDDGGQVLAVMKNGRWVREPDGCS